MTNCTKQLSFVTVLFLTGCNTSYDLPLVFLQTTTVGISAGTPAAGSPPDLSLGYRDVDVAVVPVVAAGQQVRGQSPGPAGGGGVNGPLDSRMLLAATGPSAGNGPEYSDALSVLGQFSVTTGQSNNQQGQNQQLPSVGLGKFFATGLAARQLAYGFGCQLSSKCQ